MASDTQDEVAAVTSGVILDAWLVTDIGVVRDHNEDSAYKDADRGFFVVADGMGGHAAGEIASAMAVDTVRASLESSRTEIEAFKKAPTDAGRRSIVQLLQSAVLSAHQAVFQRGQNESDKAGMGTTLDVVLVAGPEAFVAHVGDSRTYLIRDGKPSQITTDHTVAEVLVIEGKLTIEEAQVSPLRTILVNAIGVSADVGVEMAHVTLKRNDRILLCSDGLHDYFPDENEIAERLSADAPGAAIAEMVELAKTRGGHDNITGVVIHVTAVTDAVPSQLEGESTQPVEVAHNPFAADEPTETAVAGPHGRPPRMAAATPQTSRQTQPMRIIDDSAGSADTIPPPPGMPKNLAMTPKVAESTDAKTEQMTAVQAPDEAKTEQMAAVKPGDGQTSWDGETVDADDKAPVKLAEAEAKTNASANEDKDAG